MEASEINRRVAEELGYTVEEGGRGWRLLLGGNRVDSTIWTHERGAWSDIPKFCADPFAADLVRQEIERRGWELVQRAMISPHLYDATIILRTIRTLDSHYPTRGGADLNSPHMALCLAFLAACDSSREASNEK